MSRERVLLIEGIQAIAAEVSRNDHLLTPDLLDELVGFHEHCLSEGWSRLWLADMAPEYGRREWLLPVHTTGEPARWPDASRPKFWHTAEQAGWITRQGLDDSAPLVARWLCHLLGIRHRTVQLYIDHPTLARHTLVQVRSTSKIGYPGCYDLPVAGHASEREIVQVALAKELAEETGLSLDDLEALEPLGAHIQEDVRREEHPGKPPTTVRDVEYSMLYHARLQEGALERIRFCDGEVAAVAVFHNDELTTILERWPGRVAAGLRSTWATYQQTVP